MPLADDNHVVQTLAPHRLTPAEVRAIEDMAAQVLLAEYHHVVQAVAPDGSDQRRALAERLAVDRVAIAQQPAWCGVMGKASMICCAA